jgi:hypothetical protein
VDRPDIGETNSRCIRFRGSRKQRPKPNVIGAFIHGRRSLDDGVSRLADDAIASGHLACLINT